MADQHERRREASQTRRLTMTSDLPLYGVGDGWHGSRDVKIGYCHATFRKGLFHARLQDGPVVVDEITAHHVGDDGGVLMVTSHRQTAEGMDRTRLLKNFFSTSWALDHREGVHGGAGAENTRLEASPSLSPTSASQAEWRSCDVRIDGAPRRFERLSFDHHSLAIGVVDDHHVSIESHGIPVDDHHLSRVTDLLAWATGAEVSPQPGRLRDFGDWLWDVSGLP
ncbi:MAG: hypothetical protein ABSH30_01035 [Acidimicrobiales bacterium]|jgi:hypothetical protein